MKEVNWDELARRARATEGLADLAGTQPSEKAETEYSETITPPTGGCAPPSLSADSQDLGGWRHGRFVVGFVDEVNGRGAVECPGFVPTQYELRLLARHWAEVNVQTSLRCFLDDCAGSDDSRTMAFAKRRFLRIAGDLGVDECDQVWEEVEAFERERVGERNWTVFQHGTEGGARAASG